MADPTDPPSFDAIFAQQPVRRSSSTSTSSFANYTYSALQQEHFTPDGPLVDEPQSIPDQPHSFLKDKKYTEMMAGVARQESFPFNPQEDSTLIATAPQSGPGNVYSNGFPSTTVGDPMYGTHQSFRSGPTQQYGHDQSHQWAGENEQPIQYAGIPQHEFNHFQSPHPTPGPAGVHGVWGQEFIGSEEQQSFGQDGPQGGIEEIFSMGNDPTPGNDLQRIISNSSHPSRQPSRTASPFPRQQQQTPQSVPISASHSRNSSFNASRSSSPFADHPPQQDLSNPISPPAMGHPAYPRASSSPLANPNSLFSKPQSPPALIIPNSSPVLPPIVTGPAPGSHAHRAGGVSLPRPTVASDGAGGLFPPANPNISGMAGISPIADNADGPMIYIQPSTPISGLKDGRGLFDDALRRAGAMAAQHAQEGREASEGQDQGQQQQSFNVPPPQSHPLPRSSSLGQSLEPGQENVAGQGMDFAATTVAYSQQDWVSAGSSLRVAAPSRPRSKSDSIIPSPTAEAFNKDAFWAFIGAGQNAEGQDAEMLQQVPNDQAAEQWRNTVNVWKAGLGGQLSSTLDPRVLPGRDNGEAAYNQLLMQQRSGQMPSLDAQQLQQLGQMEAQRNRLGPLNTDAGVFKYESGEFSPTTLAVYQSIGLYPHAASELNGTVSAPWSQTAFNDANFAPQPATADPSQHHFPQHHFLAPNIPMDGSTRRKSVGGGEHPAMGAGTPGYGVEFSSGHKPAGSVRSISTGHRRAPRSVDFGQIGTGWGVGGGGSTSDFLQSITGDDGSLLPPSGRGRTSSHSRHSSVSSVRSASPALSISSQGSSFSHHSPRMNMPHGIQLPGHQPNIMHQSMHAPQLFEELQGPGKIPKMKVTSVATGVASENRRKNHGVFECPVPGCGSTFTRHFNLKGHLRSHNDERPFKCEYEGCPKAVVGFARQHDCKRHMLLHEGLRLFECEGCAKKFARLDALTRHHKSEQGQECAIAFPLPTNPDGSAMSESQYKQYKGIDTPEGARRLSATGASGSGSGSGRRRKSADMRDDYSGEDQSPETEMY